MDTYEFFEKKMKKNTIFYERCCNAFLKFFLIATREFLIYFDRANHILSKSENGTFVACVVASKTELQYCDTK